ncbi:hypothetical protein PC9H_006218 [Pleurotus ostreatus]|uniref:RING-type E3 ubiquitin transferase n=1 Tax=Pleurotus ostreatus TaxID=5322 RepID=A0A8H6ZW97_PLEOS|nr:uncharacterized protein PC9H_006218 [Pleurotus ostreatus]KAF7430510.1 hypothetical protein PC9H_006218 [Pleurotus ostreatus]KAJ8694788.1 hypothetical protein PTI98_007437 [Pleurotus ostreatus]
MERPRTSKPRGVCKYYSQPRGCFAGKSCKFLHGDPGTEQLTPYDKAKVCKFYQQGYCKRGDECWFRHVKAGRSVGESFSIAGPSSLESDDGFEDLCSICFDKPTTYGLLGGCSHIFCIKCIRQWRDTSDNAPDNIGSDVRKKCPMCRAPSQFITPTSEFVLHGTPEKDRVIAAYKDSMKKVKCRYFEASIGNSRGRPGCPFGKDCFYLHQNADGTPYVFTEGIPTSFRRFHSQRSTPLASQVDYIAQSLGLIQHIFDHPMGNLGLSLEVIRTGLGQVGAALDRMAPTPGAAPLELSHRSRGGTTDDGNDRREGAAEMGRDDLERMTGRLLDTINSIRMRAGREVHPESDDDSDDRDDPISLWPTDMPALVPYEQTEQAEEDAEATRAIFAEWHQPHVGSTPFRAPDVASIPVAGDVNVRERIDVTGSGVSTSPPIDTNGSAWSRLVFDHHEGSRPRWLPGPTFRAGRERAGGNDNMSDDSMPDLLELSDSEDGTESSDDETQAPCHPPLPSSELENHPLEPAADSPSSSSTTPEPTSDDKSMTSPEFTTDGRGRVIAASSPSAESTSSIIPSDQIKPS